MSIKLKREENNFTQKQMANIVGVSLLTFQRYETQKRKPNVYTAIAIAKVLNTTVEELFGGDDQSQTK